MIYKQIYNSIVGLLYITANDYAVIGVDYSGEAKSDKHLDKSGDNASSSRKTEINENGNLLTAQAALQLDEYFKGVRKVFDLPIKFRASAFSLAVWEQLLLIPYGATLSYGEIAARVGKPRSSRAVGRACHKNPIAIIIPCHRVVGKKGKLTGYAGGLDKKQLLLELENKFKGQ